MQESSIKNLGKLGEFISGEENFVPAVYSDSRGIPTIGIGFNLAQNGAKDVCKKFGLDYEAIMKDYKINILKQGKKNETCERYHITKEKANEIRDYFIKEKAAFVRGKIDGKNNKGLFDELPWQVQHALISHAYNANILIGPKIIKAVRNKDFSTVAEEIIKDAESAKKKGDYKGILNRYKKEAQLILDYDELDELVEQLLDQDRGSQFQEINFGGAGVRNINFTTGGYMQNDQQEVIEQQKKLVNRFLRGFGLMYGQLNQNIQQQFGQMNQNIEQQLGGILYCFELKNQELNQKLDKIDVHLQKKELQEIAQQRINNAREAANGIAQLGQQLKIPALQKIGSVAGNLVTIGSHLSTIGVSVPVLSSLTSGLSMAMPYVGIAVAAFSIVSSLCGGGGGDDNGLGEALQQIHQAIIEVHKAVIEMHKDMREHFQVAFKNQQRIYDAVLNVMNYMVYDFQRPVMDQLKNIDEQLQQLQEVTAIQFEALYLQKLEFLLAHVYKGTIEDNEIKKNITDLELWTSASSIKPAINGSIYYNNIDKPNLVNHIIQQMGPQSYFLNLLGYFAKHIQKRKLSDFTDQKKLDLNKLPNLIVWKSAANGLLILSKKLKENPQKQQEIYRSLENQADNLLLFIQTIKNSRQLFESLFDEYHQAYQELQSAIAKEVTRLQGNEKNFVVPENATIGSLFGKVPEITTALQKLDVAYHLIHIFCYLANIQLPWKENSACRLVSSKEILKINYLYANAIKVNSNLFTDNQGWNYTSWAKSQQWFSIPRNGTSHEVMGVGSHSAGLHHDNTGTEIGFRNWWGRGDLWFNGWQWINTCKTNLLTFNNNLALFASMRCAGPGFKGWLVDPYKKQNIKELVITAAWQTQYGISDPQYNETLRVEVLNIHNQDVIFSLMRLKDGIELYSCNPNTQSEGIKLANGPEWSDSKGYAAPDCYKSVRTNVLRVKSGENIYSRLFLLGRNGKNVELHCYAPDTAEWLALPVLNQWSNGEGFNQESYYETIRTEVVSINGHDCLLVMARNKDYFEMHCFDPATNQWQALAHGPELGGKEWHSKPQYYRTLRTLVLTLGAGEDARQVLLVMMKNKNHYEMYCYDPSNNAWYDLPEGPAWADGAENGIYEKDVYYEFIRAVASREKQNTFYLLYRKTDGLYTYEYKIDPLLLLDKKAKQLFLEKFEDLNKQLVKGEEKENLLLGTSLPEGIIYSVLFQIPGYEKKLLGKDFIEKQKLIIGDKPVNKKATYNTNYWHEDDYLGSFKPNWSKIKNKFNFKPFNKEDLKNIKETTSFLKTNIIDQQLHLNGLSRGKATMQGNNCLLDSYFQLINKDIRKNLNENLGELNDFVNYVRQRVGRTKGEMLSINDEVEGIQVLSAIREYVKDKVGITVAFDLNFMVALEEVAIVDNIDEFCNAFKEGNYIIRINIIQVNANHYEPVWDESENIKHQEKNKNNQPTRKPSTKIEEQENEEEESSNPYSNIYSNNHRNKMKEKKEKLEEKNENKDCKQAFLDLLFELVNKQKFQFNIGSVVGNEILIEFKTEKRHFKLKPPVVEDKLRELVELFDQCLLEINENCKNPKNYCRTDIDLDLDNGFRTFKIINVNNENKVAINNFLQEAFEHCKEIEHNKNGCVIC